ncbi:hypothetical protein KKG45_05070, partial [bacterium]|nr:hypothetical protein [bacterium]
VLIFVLSLIAGCGGDSPTAPPVEDPPWEPVTVAGQLAMPEGYTGDVSALTVACGTDSAGVAADGSFTIDLLDGDAQLAVVVGPGGGPLFMGWLGGAKSTLDARASAEALTWFGVGGWIMPPTAAGPVRELIAGLGEALDPLTAAVAAAMIEQPAGLSEPCPGIRDALDALVAQVLELDPPGATNKGIVIEPGEERSGIAVLNTGGANAVTLKNSYRRRVQVFVQRTGWLDQGDVHHDLNDAIQDFEIPPVAGYAGVINTIGGYFTGDVAYTPVTMPPITLENIDNAKRTYYEIITGGLAGLNPPSEPWLTSSQQDQIDWVALKSLVWDFFVPLVMNVVATANQVEQLDGLLGVEDGLGGDIQTFVGFCITTVPAIVTHASQGNIVDALAELWSALTGTGDFQNSAFGLVRNIFQYLGVEAGYTGMAMERAAEYLGLVGWIDIVGNYLDSGAVATHCSLSNHSEVWELTVTSPLLTLTPREPVIPLGSQVDTLRINLVDDTGGDLGGASFKYHWHCGGGHGRIINPIHPSAGSNDFETSSDWVRYESDIALGAGADEVYAEIYVTLGGIDTYVGADTTAVTVIGPELVLPDSLFTCPGGNFPLNPTLDPPYGPDVVLRFQWQCGGAAGTLSGPEGQTGSWTTTGNPAASYSGDPAGGFDTIVCSVAIETDGGTFATVADAAIDVEVADQEMFNGATYGESHYDPAQNIGGWGVYVRFTKIPGVARYRVHGYDFYDWAYYGDHFDRTGPPWPTYSQDLGDEVLVFLTGGGGNGDPADALAWGLSRFEGAIWEITPVCP